MRDLKITCSNCREEFTSTRKTAKFCSPKCRVEYSRKTTIEKGLPDLIRAVDKLDADNLRGTPQTGERITIPRKKKTGFFIDDVATEYFYTGIDEFDAVTGFPKERVSLIYGPEGVGKSTLMYNVIKSLTDQARVLYIDTEAALSPERLSQLEIDVNSLDIRRDQLIEDVYDAVIEGVSEYDLIIVDSLAACTFRAELVGEAADANMGIKPRIINKLCRVLPVLLTREHCTVILVNQERDRFDGMGKSIPGGKGQTYASSLTIRLSTQASDRFQKNKQIAGHWVTAEIRKSRVCAPFQKMKFKIFY